MGRDDPHDYEGNDYDDLGCGNSFCTICGDVGGYDNGDLVEDDNGDWSDDQD